LVTNGPAKNHAKTPTIPAIPFAVAMPVSMMYVRRKLDISSREGLAARNRHQRAACR